MTIQGSQASRAALTLAFRRPLLTVLAICFGLNLLYFAPSLFMMQVYDRVLPTRGVTTLVALGALAFLAVLLIGALDWLRGRLLERIARLVDLTLAPRVARYMLDPARRRTNPAAASLSRALDTVRGTLCSPSVTALLDLPFVPLFLIAAAMIHPAILILILFGVAASLVPAFAQRRPPASQTGAIALATQEFEWGQADTIRALGMSEAMAARHERTRLLARQDAAASGLPVWSSVTRAFRMGLQMAVLALGALLAINDQISPGALIAVSVMSSRALAPFDNLAGAWRSLRQARNAWRDLSAALSTPEREGFAYSEPLTGQVSLERVAYLTSSDARAILHDASFQLNPGEIVGVVGPSGAGKSTLARLVVGASQPTHGVVRLDGVDLARWDRNALGRQMGYLPQEVTLFAGSVADNIARFDERAPDIRRHAIVEAARQAGAHDLIARLPAGYDTLLAPAGRGLSAGQSQRIALARALYGNPTVLVLDEPNAHLDEEGEAALVSALKAAAARGAGVLVIAHRAGVMNIADRVVMVRDGAVQDIRKEDLLSRRIVVSATSPRRTA